jgi:hypothetical protein
MKKKTPWAWVPTLYFAEGLPYVAVMTISLIMYKRLGLSNTDITLYTSAGWMIYITFLYEAAPGKNWNSHEFFQEKTIKVKGVLGIHKTTKGKYQWQVLPSNSSDLVVVS